MTYLSRSSYLLQQGTFVADGSIKGTVDVPAYTVNGEYTATRAPTGQSQ